MKLHSIKDEGISFLLLNFNFIDSILFSTSMASFFRFALVSGRVLFGGNMKELEILHAVK